MKHFGLFGPTNLNAKTTEIVNNHRNETVAVFVDDIKFNQHWSQKITVARSPTAVVGIEKQQTIVNIWRQSSKYVHAIPQMINDVAPIGAILFCVAIKCFF